jgi:hypothetical protein
MGKGVAKTDGGVSDHAVKRVIQQYASPLNEKEIRKIVRDEKNLSGVGNNGYFLFSISTVRKLRLNIQPDKFVIGIVSFGTVVTVEDKDFVRIS